MPSLAARTQFVFVVCGGREHIEELNFSLSALRRRTRHPVTVVTELSRNQAAIEHPQVLDVSTPPRLTHHQASIFLKTSLHKILPAGPCYCYLDTDVVALAPAVDQVFDQRSGPVTFARDHCHLAEFSPYAVQCGCLVGREPELRVLKALEQELTTPAALAEAETRRQAPLRRVLSWLWPRECPTWTWDPACNVWRTPDGRNLHDFHCDHLREKIFAKFGVRILERDWRHWNGGVFLFDPQAHAFLEAWHEKTLKIFEDPTWTTRDQGTLAATAWEMGLERAPVLDSSFNLIADYDKENVRIHSGRLQTRSGRQFVDCSPAFIHVYHHFGDTGWSVWNWVEASTRG